MKYISTRGSNDKVSLSEAILKGLSDDGGLFVPEFLPRLEVNKLDINVPYTQFCEQVLRPFFEGDPLEEKLAELCQTSFNFPLKLHTLNENTTVMELFHGPTLSFKDFGARFLASCLSELAHKDKVTVMVATSGDTGSAVASAFYQKPNVNVIVLFPEGKISERQRHQITCWGDNVHVLALQGVFDDCQRLLKQAFSDSWWQAQTQLCTANSINIGRLLPQICYYAHTSLKLYQEKGEKTGVIVPSGNLGNVTAAYFAKIMGFPIREIVIASNENKVVSDYLATGEYDPKPSIATLANAMDVGQPSNFERLTYLFKEFSQFSENVRAFSVDDEQIKTEILRTYNSYRYAICPHTATAMHVREALGDQLWVVAATADPSKFETVIEPIVGHQLPVPETLQRLLAKKEEYKVIEPNMDAIKATIQSMQW